MPSWMATFILQFSGLPQPNVNAEGIQGLLDILIFHAKSLEQQSSLVQLPLKLRNELAEAGFTTGRSRVAQKVVSTDGTQKFLLQLHDGRLVETVGIPNDRDGRLTVCLSSQVMPFPKMLILDSDSWSSIGLLLGLWKYPLNKRSHPF